MTKTAAKQEPELFAAPADKQPKARPLTEGPKKGGRNPTSQIKERPPAPGAISKKREMVVHQPQPPAQPRSVLELCLMAAKDPTIPTDRVKAFLDMADQQERKEAEVLFDHAMMAAQSEMPSIPRDSYNKHTKSWWARIESVSAKCDPIIRKHGFTLKHGVGDQRIEDHYHLYVDVTWTGVLSSGKKASFTKRFDADIGRDDKGPKGEGTKSLAQGSGSSITYGRRFLKLMVFDVLVLGMDKDGNPAGADATGDSLITEQQADQIKAICADKNIGLPLFQQAFRVQAVEDLPAIRYDDVIARLKAAPKAEPKKETAADHE